jgi:hypothetical protein
MFLKTIHDKIKKVESNLSCDVAGIELRLASIEKHLKGQMEAEAKKIADHEQSLVNKSAPYIANLKAKLEAVKTAFEAEITNSEKSAGTAAADVKEIVNLVSKTTL